MYLYGFIIPFCRRVSTGQEYGRGTTNRIIEILDLLHELDHSLVLTVADVWLLGNTEAMLSADTALPLLYPFIHERLKLLLNSFVKSSCRNVQMQICISHVAVSNNIDNRVVGSITN